MTSQFTRPSAALRPWIAGLSSRMRRTSKPESPKSDIRFTTTEIRSAATIVSPAKGSSPPTSVSPSNSSEALGKWRSRLISSFSKSSRAVSILLASLFTMSAIFPFRTIGTMSATANTAAITIAVTFASFFISYRLNFQWTGGTAWSPPRGSPRCGRGRGLPSGGAPR